MKRVVQAKKSGLVHNLKEKTGPIRPVFSLGIQNQL